ncbi:hypothetical protein [Xenophilus sp.]|uniref:hypothetical protein n=1 Tax=Xenophilus sp. TaxID=1873499 RepID=UPI0037DCC9FD
MSLLAGCGGGGGGGGSGFLPIAGTPTGPTTGDTSSPPTTPTTPTTPTHPSNQETVLTGQVTAGGAPVADAAVSAGGAAARTDAEGRYRLAIADAQAPATVLVKSRGHLTMAKEAPRAQGQTTTLDVTLQPVDVQRTFEAAGGVVAVVNGAVIDIPAAGIQDANGNPYDGPVHLAAAYRNPTTAAGVDAFLQPYRGEDSGAAYHLQTVGVIEATLTDPAGNPLQLSQPATLVYPGVSRVDRGEASIPLWYYDEQRMLWIREGQATRQSDGSYLGQVSHFSVWNLDQQWGGAYTGVTVNVCVNYQNGASSRFGTYVFLSTWGYAPNGYGNPLDAGTHQFVNAPANAPLTLTFTDQGGALQVVNLPAAIPGQTVSAPCVTLVGTADYVPPPPPPPPTPTPADAPPSLFDGSHGVFFSADASDYDYGTFSLNVNAGTVTGTGTAGTQPQGSNYTITLTGQLAAGGYVSFTGAGSPNGPILFTGRFETLSGGPTGTWTYLSPPAGVTTPPAAFFADATPS